MLGETTVPTWQDSSLERILDCLGKALAMTRRGLVDILVDGHSDQCVRGRDAIL